MCAIHAHLMHPDSSSKPRSRGFGCGLQTVNRYVIVTLMHRCQQVDDPIEIIKRLMIGSEGTLGFVSRATYNTVPEWPHKVTCTQPCWALVGGSREL